MSKAHSKFSASGAERWFNCSASVEAAANQPDRETSWAKEGTEAHALLESMLKTSIESKAIAPGHGEMFRHALNAMRFIMWIWAQNPGSDIMVETQIWLKFIHPEMFGTFDGAVIDHFGTLHVFDFKYGAGHAVSPVQNLQMIFYAIGLANKFDWNFNKVRMWIIQPRIKGYDGPTYWEIPIGVLESYVPKFKAAVHRVLHKPKFVEGPWCHWCKAKGKSTCPLTDRAKKALTLFTPVGGSNGQSEAIRKEEHDQEKQSRSRKEKEKDEGKDAAQKTAPEKFNEFIKRREDAFERESMRIIGIGLNRQLVDDDLFGISDGLNDNGTVGTSSGDDGGDFY